MKITIIGLGLMGGSLAYAIRGFKDSLITGYDENIEVMNNALESNAIDEAAVSMEKAVSDADLTVFCINPASIIESINKCGVYFKKNSIVSDICGIKEKIINEGVINLPQGVDYVGIHPMAGKEVGGFVNADKDIYKNAGFIVIPIDSSAKASVDLLIELSYYIGAGRVCTNTASEHDRLIAYTSDLMHISATALCREFPENLTLAHTAGAFRDCTRIANIDASLWSDLLIGNSEHILHHLDNFISDLNDIRSYLAENDIESLYKFLSVAGKNKKEMLHR